MLTHWGSYSGCPFSKGEGKKEYALYMQSHLQITLIQAIFMSPLLIQLLLGYALISNSLFCFFFPILHSADLRLFSDGRTSLISLIWTLAIYMRSQAERKRQWFHQRSKAKKQPKGDMTAGFRFQNHQLEVNHCCIAETKIAHLWLDWMWNIGNTT